MENYIQTATKLYVAVNVEGEIVNSNDFKELGPAFARTDTKVMMRMENEKAVENYYALHIDHNFNKQGAFDISNCTKITAAIIAKRYCENNHISPVKRSWLYQDNDENCYQVVDADGVEYHFHIARAWFDDGSPRDHYGAYISIKNNKGNISFINITNINNL